jgi:hypothetical protein
VTEPTPPGSDGDSEGESPDGQRGQGANQPHPADGSAAEQPHELDHPDSSDGVSEQPTQQNPSRRDDLFGSHFVRRSLFLGQVLLELVGDGVWLAGVYAWYRLIDWLVGPFEHIEKYELWVLVGLKVVLTFVPGLIVVWYVIVDFIGAIKRIWKHRND